MVTTQMYTFSHVFAILICTWPTHVKMTRKDRMCLCYMLCLNSVMSLHGSTVQIIIIIP
jgi:hypothetical protein